MSVGRSVSRSIGRSIGRYVVDRSIPVNIGW